MRVFLSHASEDAKASSEICLALRGAGHAVFFDADDLPPGGDYNTRIRDALDVSDAFVFLLSPASVAQGSYTLTELKFAKQKWPQPWGRVLPVMIRPTPWEDVDPYLGAVTVLQPAGNPAAEVAEALSRLGESPEAKAHSARWRSPLFALQAGAAGAMGLAWIGMVLAFGIDAAVVRHGAAVLLGVLAVCALQVAVVGAILRARDAAMRTLAQAYRHLLSRTGFGAVSALLAASAAMWFIWQLATLNVVTFMAAQDVELFAGQASGAARSLGVVKAGEPSDLVLRVGTQTLAYRAVGGPEDEMGALDPIDVAPPWSGMGRRVVAVPKLERLGTARRQGG